MKLNPKKTHQAVVGIRYRGEKGRATKGESQGFGPPSGWADLPNVSCSAPPPRAWPTPSAGIPVQCLLYPSTLSTAPCSTYYPVLAKQFNSVMSASPPSLSAAVICSRRKKGFSSPLNCQGLASRRPSKNAS